MSAHDRLESNREKQHAGKNNQPSLLTFSIVKITFFKLKKNILYNFVLRLNKYCR